MTSITLAEFESFQKTGVSLIDCRPTNDFASSFIPNSINASLNGSYEYMASCIFDKGKHLVVICEGGKEGESVLRLESEGFKDISIFNFEIWENGGGKMSTITRHLASEAQTHVDSMKDVSNAEDWDVLHVKGTTSVPLIDLINDFGLISEGDVLYCGNGHKSMAAASFLKIKGVNVTDIIGGLSAMLVEAPDLEI